MEFNLKVLLLRGKCGQKGTKCSQLRKYTICDTPDKGKERKPSGLIENLSSA